MSGVRLWRWWADRAGGAMMRMLALAGMCLALAACGSLPSIGFHPTPTATPAPRVRFTADWAQGLSGWQATPGWTVSNGALESDASAGLSLTIPYQPPTATYAVELDLQVVSVVGNSGYYTLNAAPTPSADGYRAGVFDLLAPGPRPNGDHPTISTTIDPLDDQDSTTSENYVADFEPGDGVKTYRIVVSGPSVVLYVNGRYFVVASSTKTAQLATGPLQLRVGQAHLRITGLRVIA